MKAFLGVIAPPVFARLRLMMHYSSVEKALSALPDKPDENLH